MPEEFPENIEFDQHLAPCSVRLSGYQKQLNLVYQVTSPVLELVQASRDMRGLNHRSSLESLVTESNEALSKWRSNVPLSLRYDDMEDLKSDSTTEERMHKLQALALKLTHDNLVIIVNRMLLADKRDAGEKTDHHSDLVSVQNNMHRASIESIAFNRCLRAALSISSVARKSNLMALAQKTHLISFLGINLFTANVVMFICALSDVLSDASQEAKRAMARTLRLQKSLAQHASLSMQCSIVSEDLIKKVLEKERAELLQDTAGETIQPPLSTDDLFLTPASFEGSSMDWNPDFEATQLPDTNLRESLLSLHRGKWIFMKTLCKLSLT
jgi:hypothetical protein